jgi:hypothetical protein
MSVISIITGIGGAEKPQSLKGRDSALPAFTFCRTHHSSPWTALIELPFQKGPFGRSQTSKNRSLRQPADALPSYSGLAQDYAHQVVDHAVQYVNGRVHTNGLENYWSLVKRGISGTYVSR